MRLIRRLMNHDKRKPQRLGLTEKPRRPFKRTPRQTAGSNPVQAQPETREQLVGSAVHFTAELRSSPECRCVPRGTGDRLRLWADLANQLGHRRQLRRFLPAGCVGARSGRRRLGSAGLARECDSTSSSGRIGTREPSVCETGRRFCAKRRYSSSNEPGVIVREVKSMVKALHAAGIGGKVARPSQDS